MKRRAFIAGLLVVTAVGRAQAQRTAKVYRIARVYSTTPVAEAIKPLKPLRGESRIDPVEPVVTTRVLSTFAHEAAGAIGARLSLRPLFFEGG